MKSVISYPVKVFATGFVVLVFISLLFCYVRIRCEASLLEGIPDDARSILRSPSKLVPERLENDPNVERCSRVSVQVRNEEPVSLGIIDYLQAIIPGGRRSNSHGEFQHLHRPEP